jgi:uncharacterized protein
MLPDVNILVHAFRTDAPDHEKCRGWLEGLVNGEAAYGMAPMVLSGMVRIVTHPKVFANPSLLEETFEFCETLLSQSHCVIVRPRSRHWTIFRRLCKEADARGNLVPDAWLAAMAIESGCEWITLDRDFARFSELNWRAPW